MRRYIEQLHAREPYEKRQFAMQVSAVLTGIVFLVWLSTLPLRLTSPSAQNTVADASAASLVAATANAGSAFQNQIQQLGSGAGTQASSDQASPSSDQNQSQSQNPGQQSQTYQYPDGSSGNAPTSSAPSVDSGGATIIGAPDSATTLNQ